MGRRVRRRGLDSGRTFDPSSQAALADAQGRIVTGADRIGKRLVLALDGDLHLVLH
ncbi:MAG: hypothetical protein HY814_05215 [Candidatus Riflebacteria bacterium]|nr:hypothetical protein [Candidatus Riflebacteria bacterium]